MRRRTKWVAVFFLAFVVLVGPEAFTEEGTPADQILPAEIRAMATAWKQLGEEGLRAFVQEHRATLSGEAILDFARRPRAQSTDLLEIEDRLRMSCIALEELGDDKRLASALLLTGYYYEDVGDYSRALSFYDQAFVRFEKLGDLRGQGRVWMNRGAISQFRGDNRQALEMFGKAETLFEKTGDLVGQGDLCFNRSIILFRRGNTAEALEMYEKALPFFEKANSLWGQGSVFQQRGMAYTRLGETARALEEFDKSFYFYDKADSPIGRGAVFLGRGEACLFLGENDRALGMFLAAYGEFGRAGYSAGQARALFGEANVLARMKKNDEALDRYEKALGFLEGLRRRTGLEELKSGFIRKESGNYDRAALFMLGNGFKKNAFRTVEGMRARLFLDRLAESQVDLSKGIPPDLKAKRNELEARLTILREQCRELMGENPEEGDRNRHLEALSGEIAEAEKDLEALKAGIRLHNPLYASVEYPETPTAELIRSQVLRPGETLLEYYFGGDEAWCFVLTRGAFDAVRLPVARKDIERDARLLVSTLTTYRSGAKPSAGERLYDCLLRPVERMISGKTLIVVPDGVVAKLPFEMLEKRTRGNRSFLVEKYEVKYVPSAAVLAFYRLKYRGGKAPDKFIGFGDPVYDYDSFTKGLAETAVKVSLEKSMLHGSEPVTISLPRLPSSGEEVRIVDHLFQERKRESSIRLREAASEEVVRESELSDYGYIHFATHGIVTGSFQALVLSRMPGNAADGFLTMGEIMNLDWDARLVVLSGCETGLGTMEQGEGVTGLARAVMYAGSPATVVSLWSVSDEGTKELMTRFYRILLTQGKTPAEALRAAKLELLRRTVGEDGNKRGKTVSDGADSAGKSTVEGIEPVPADYTSPFFWAPFVLYGE